MKKREGKRRAGEDWGNRPTSSDPLSSGTSLSSLLTEHLLYQQSHLLKTAKEIGHMVPF